MSALECYAQTPEGLLLIADGMSKMSIYDGLQATAEEAGLAKPATALTVAGSGAGNIVGDYTAYVRFLDRRGNVSNLSPISNTYTAAGAITGTITGATNSTPIVITTTVAHGLATGASVNITGILGNTGANNVWIITVLSLTTFSLTGSAGSGTYVSGGTFVAGILTITYTGVSVPTTSKVVRRQILRNTAGQTVTYYVDVDTTNLVLTTFNSTKDDSTLATGEDVSIFNDDGSLNANAHAQPPSHKSIIAHHQGRMFAVGEVIYNTGACGVTNGSTTVTGLGTEWVSALAGRDLWVTGATQEYEISSVDTTLQTLTLTEAYGGVTDPMAVYAIRPAPAERRLLYYTEAGLPESWPAVNAISLQEDGDELTGLLVMGSFLYVLERRHIYRFTFQVNPGVDGAAFIATIRGCINNRCHVVVEDTAYCLDQQGIHAFGGGETPEPISQPITSYFEPHGGINWAASEHFHANHIPGEECIRWFVALSGELYPRHAFCFSYRDKSWWIEEYVRPISSSCTGNLQGARRVFMGADSRKVLLMAEGNLDGVVPAQGTIRSMATSAHALSLTDLTATFSANLPGNSIAIVKGRGRDQVRTVVEVDGTTLYINIPWEVEPDSTSLYQLGGIQWAYSSKWLAYEEAETDVQTKVAVIYQTTLHDALLNLRIFEDYSSSPTIPRISARAEGSEGFETIAGLPDYVANMNSIRGYVQQRMNRHKELNIPGKRFMSVRIGGVSNADPVLIYRMLITGAAER